MIAPRALLSCVRLGPGLRNAVRDYCQGPVALIPALVLLLTIREFGAAGDWGSRQVLALSLGMTLSVRFREAVARPGGRVDRLTYQALNPRWEVRDA